MQKRAAVALFSLSGCLWFGPASAQAPRFPAEWTGASTETAIAPSRAGEPPAAKARALVALTVSGGISLGSYEAGLNWALLRLLAANLREVERGGATESGDAYVGLQKTLDLVSMTGASAGNINAFFGAVEWCKQQTPSSNDFTENLFWRGWIPVGIDQLFPGEQSCEEYAKSIGSPDDFSCERGDTPYLPTDGVFSRRAFSKILAEFKQTVGARGTYREGCSFPVGVTVTKALPEQVEGQHLHGLEVTTQRFAVLLRARVQGGVLVFEQERATPGALVGNQLYLPTHDGNLVSYEQVLEVIQASSAFPAAFGPVTLDYCLERDLDRGRCTAKNKKRALFLDGGLFDNLPIGLALRSFEDFAPEARPSERVVMYLDPDRRRHLRGDGGPAHAGPDAGDDEREGRGREPATRGFAYLSSLLSRFITVARQYELQSTIRFGNGKLEAKSIATSRFSPIFGGYLGAFAGFLARPLREYDYYVGIYDALYHLASEDCDLESSSQHPLRRGECLLDRVERYQRVLRLEDGSPAAFVVQHQLRAELEVMLGRAAFDAFRRRQHAALARLEAATTTDKVIAALHGAIALARSEQDKSGKEPSFEWVLDQADVDASAIETRPFTTRSDRALFLNRAALLGSLARRVAQRLVDIEADEEDRAGDTAASLLQFGVEVYFNGREYTPRLRWSPSTVPDGASAVDKALFGLLPYYATARIPEGGAEVGYLPTWYFGSGWGLTAPLAPLSWVRARGEQDLIGARGGVSLMRSFSGFPSRLELGAYAGYAYRTSSEPNARGPERFGLEFVAQPLYNRTRLSLAIDTDLDGAVRVSSQVGVADLNGLAYWLRRVLEP